HRRHGHGLPDRAGVVLLLRPMGQVPSATRTHPHPRPCCRVMTLCRRIGGGTPCFSDIDLTHAMCISCPDATGGMPSCGLLASGRDRELPSTSLLPHHLVMTR